MWYGQSFLCIFIRKLALVCSLKFIFRSLGQKHVHLYAILLCDMKLMIDVKVLLEIMFQLWQALCRSPSHAEINFFLLLILHSGFGWIIMNLQYYISITVFTVAFIVAILTFKKWKFCDGIQYNCNVESRNDAMHSRALF